MFRTSFSSNTMGDENPIRTLGDYSKPSHEGYRNTIKLPVGNNVVPLRSDTIRLVQNKCSFHVLWSEDPNQHLKDFLKLMDSLDHDGENRERMHLRPQNFGNDILMFQQHHGESLSKAWTRFKDLLQKVHHYGIDRWLQIQIFYYHVSFHIKCEIDSAASSNSSIRMLMNLGKSMRISPFTTTRAGMTLKNSSSRSRLCSIHIPHAYADEVQVLKPKHWKLLLRLKITEMFRLLKELTTCRTPEKVLIREDAKFPVTNNVNSISLAREEEENNKMDETLDNTEIPMKEAVKNNKAENELIKEAEEEKTNEIPRSWPVEYYLKHSINKKLIEGLVES
ncbi:hypothetical protein Tco_1079802 [Tanacetum coccineum]|uniref:Zinc finger, CCHC-type n=1 Tax=Tanacetum coccineum TaxID=301880 RepID=A0ABQ5HUL8_9ASTR